jgi:hypothetical protein
MIDHGFVLAEVAEAEVRRLSLCKITPPASIVTIKLRFCGRSTKYWRVGQARLCYLKDGSPGQPLPRG